MKTILKRLSSLWLLLLFLVFPIQVFGSNTINAGIVDGLWFSEDRYLEGQELELNLVLYNNSNQVMTGSVSFFENEVSFSRVDIAIEPGELEKITVQSEPSLGEQRYSALITQTNLDNPDRALLPRVVESEKVVVVEADTDRDGIADEDDTDDDGDGFSDIQERQEGTDPLDSEDRPVIDDAEEDNNQTPILEELDNFLDPLLGLSLSKDESTSNLDEDSTSSKTNDANQENVIETLQSHVAKVQNKALPYVERAHKQAHEKKNLLQQDFNQSSTSSASLEDAPVPRSDQKKSKVPYILTLLWLFVLDLVKIIVSCWWCLLLLSLLLAIYVGTFIIKRFRS